MLVLTRKPGEKLVIGDGIVVTFLGFKGDAIRLGIEAPASVRVLREELLPIGPADPAAGALRVR